MENSGISLKASDAALGYLMLRLTLGVNLLMHGLSRLFEGESKFVVPTVQMFQGSFLPHPLVVAFLTVLPWFEAIIGLLILIGLRTRLVLTLAALLIAALTFGVTSLQNWTAAGEQLIYAIAFALLIAFAAVDRYSVDARLRG